MTKRQLGIVFILIGLGGVTVLFIADFAGASQFDGVGPMQRLALGAGALITLVGLTLLPLGDRPA